MSKRVECSRDIGLTILTYPWSPPTPFTTLDSHYRIYHICMYIYIYIYTCTTRWSQESLWYQAASQVPMEIMCFYLRSGGRGNDFHQVLLHTVDGQNPSPAVIAKTPHFAILKPSQLFGGILYKSMFLQPFQGAFHIERHTSARAEIHNTSRELR